MKVYILTDAEAGWDCIRGVYRTEEEANKHKDEQSKWTTSIVHEKEVKSKFENDNEEE